MPTRAERRQDIINATQNGWVPVPGRAFGRTEGALAEAFADEVLSHQAGGGGGPELSIAQKARIAVNLNTIGTAWRNDRGIMDRMQAEIDRNPLMKAKLTAIGDYDPARFSGIMAGYVSNRAGFNASINSAYSNLPQDRQTARAPAQARAERPTSPPPPQRRSPPAAPAVRERPAPAAASPARTAPSDTPQPADVAASVTGAAVTAAAPGAAFTAEDIGLENGILDIVGSKLEAMFPDMANQIQTFKNTIRADPALQARIAENLNNNPEFMAEFEKLGQPGSNNTELLQQFGRQPIEDLLRNPQKLADDAYLESMTAQLKGASGGVGGMLQNLLGNLNLGGIGGQIMSFLQPLMDMLGDLFRGFSANGGNVMRMTNGSGNLFENALGNLGSAMHLGTAMRLNDPYLLAEAQVVDRNNDGNINDADKLEVTDASGNKHNVFETRGVTDGRNAQGQILRAYVSEIDPANGQPKAMKYITVNADGSVTTADANAPPSTQTPPPVPTPVNQDLANRNAPGLDQALTPPVTG